GSRQCRRRAGRAAADDEHVTLVVDRHLARGFGHRAFAIAAREDVAVRLKDVRGKETVLVLTDLPHDWRIVHECLPPVWPARAVLEGELIQEHSPAERGISGAEFSRNAKGGAMGVGG